MGNLRSELLFSKTPHCFRLERNIKRASSMGAGLQKCDHSLLFWVTDQMMNLCEGNLHLRHVSQGKQFGLMKRFIPKLTEDSGGINPRRKRMRWWQI
ncbi:hypothetical protein BaRGS_00032187 [Batillaria attramentaria]|uniref:Uncharacterized protein n=1 Tax=Batillaria attramentaria TaxID=370345 RepID=A0ABD0JNE1_9CAEN